MLFFLSLKIHTLLLGSIAFESYVHVSLTWTQSVRIVGDLVGQVTNDSLMLVATGRSGLVIAEEFPERLAVFRALLREACISLAQLIVRDGEGVDLQVAVAEAGAGLEHVPVGAPREPGLHDAGTAASGIELVTIVVGLETMAVAFYILAPFGWVAGYDCEPKAHVSPENCRLNIPA